MICPTCNKNECQIIDGIPYICQPCQEKDKHNEVLASKERLTNVVGIPEYFTEVPEVEWGGSFVFLSGDYGSGKTTEACGMLINAVKNRKSARFINIPMFLKRMQQEVFEENRTTEWGFLKEYLDCDVLCLDDVGSEKGSEWTQQTLYIIVDYRLSRNLPIIVTTNFDLDDIHLRVGERIGRRFMEMAG